MNSIEVVAVVEGATEQTFVRDVLAPYLGAKGIFIRAAKIGKPGHKGGNVKLDRAGDDIRLHLQQRPDTYVTTMFDYFRIDSDWPGVATVRINASTGTNLSATDKGQIIEAETKQAIDSLYGTLNSTTRFIPYIEMHEFEALLFSDAGILSEICSVRSETIQEILNQFPTPEDINNHPDNAPSKRLDSLSSRYRKTTTGIAIAKEIGVDRMRSKCPHFNSWLSKIEALV